MARKEQSVHLVLSWDEALESLDFIASPATEREALEIANGRTEVSPDEVVFVIPAMAITNKVG